MLSAWHSLHLSEFVRKGCINNSRLTFENREEKTGLQNITYTGYKLCEPGKQELTVQFYPKDSHNYYFPGEMPLEIERPAKDAMAPQQCISSLFFPLFCP